MATYGCSPFSQNLLNAGAKNMNVNGSGTPQTFTYAPSVTIELSSLSVILQQSGTTPFNVFGALGSALTNGLLLQTSINGNTNTLATIKDNSDMCTRFAFSQFGNGGVLSILSIVTPQGFGNTSNVFVGTLHFPDQVILVNGDTLTCVVQDNLSTVNFLQMAVTGLNLV